MAEGTIEETRRIGNASTLQDEEVAEGESLTSDEYIRSVLDRYEVLRGRNSPAYQAGQALYPVITEWAGNALLEVRYTGSYAKGTAVRGNTDIDLFISLSSNTSGTLREIYNSLFKFLQGKGLRPKKQNVSIRVNSGGAAVDLVPGRRQRNSADHSLYRNRAGTWIQTNISTHISLVTNSGRTEEVRAIKIWRQLQGLDFPSIYLELTVLDALYGRWKDRPAPNVLIILEYLRDHFQGARVVDPANTNNVISEELSASGRAAVARQAKSSLNQDNWQDIIW